MSSRRRSRPGTPASFNAPPSGRRTPLGALQQNNAGASAPLRLGGRACCSALRCLCRAAVAPAPLGSANRTLTAVNAVPREQPRATLMVLARAALASSGGSSSSATRRGRRPSARCRTSARAARAPPRWRTAARGRGASLRSRSTCSGKRRSAYTRWACTAPAASAAPTARATPPRTICGASLRTRSRQSLRSFCSDSSTGAGFQREARALIGGA